MAYGTEPPPKRVGKAQSLKSTDQAREDPRGFSCSRSKKTAFARPLVLPRPGRLRITTQHLRHPFLREGEYFCQRLLTSSSKEFQDPLHPPVIEICNKQVIKRAQMGQRPSCITRVPR